MKVKIKCEGSHQLPIQQLNIIEDIQKNVKTISDENFDKLKNSILKNGFCEPLILWKKNEKKIICVAGNQRLKVLNSLAKDDNITMPDYIPVNYVEASSEKEVKKILLSLASTFGEVDQTELSVWLSDSDISFEEIKEAIHYPDFAFEIDDADIDSTTSNFDKEIKQDETILKIKIPRDKEAMLYSLIFEATEKLKMKKQYETLIYLLEDFLEKNK